MNPPEQTLVETFYKLFELRGKDIQIDAGVLVVVGLKSDPPNLFPFGLRKIGKKLTKACNQVTLGKGDVDRKANTQLLLQFIDSLAQGFGQMNSLFGSLDHQVLQADRQNSAIYGAPGAIALEHIDEFGPGVIVDYPV